MKKTIAVALTLATTTFAFADTPKKDAAPAASKDVMVVAKADLKWADGPGFKGVKMAVADGDPSAGPAHFFMKFVGGFKAPMHHHTADHFVTVVSGTLVLTIDGKDVKLPAGSYFSFTKAKPHATACAAGADCVLVIDSRDKWDVLPEAAPATPPAKK